MNNQKKCYIRCNECKMNICEFGYKNAVQLGTSHMILFGHDVHIHWKGGCNG